ncbi:MAG: hypothetical protein ACRDFQ_05235 [Anaerolineales bacterium]
MATRFQNRRTLLLAVLLALIAAGTLCVWGAAAAGFTFSSPALQAFIDAITGRGEADFAQIRDGGGGQSDGIMPVTGDGDGDAAAAGDGNGGGGGEGDTATGENCLLGLLCASAELQAGGGSGVSDASIDLNSTFSGQTGRTRCFLGLICLTANADASLGGMLDADVAAAADTQDNDVNASLSADIAESTRRFLHVLLGLFIHVD